MRDNRPTIIAGDRCWMLDGRLLYFVEITEVCLHLVDTPHEFQMITARGASLLIGTEDRYRIYEHVHRSDLFQYPDERSALIQELQMVADRMNRYVEESVLFEERDATDIDLGLM